MIKTGVLECIAEFCNKERKSDLFNPFNCNKNEKKVILTADSETINASLIKWVKESSQRILRDTIPDEFWTEHDLLKPINNLDELCPKSLEEPSHMVLLVVLWSWCSPDCSEHIVKCFRFGADNWKVDDEYGETDWLGSFVKCVWASVAYARQEIQKKAKEVGHMEEFTKSTTLLNACTLRQAVCNSSRWFSMLTVKKSSDVFIRTFVKVFLKKGILHANFRGPIGNLGVLSDTDSSVVKFVSVQDWFKNFVILPILGKILKLEPMANLVRGIESTQGKENQGDLKKTCQALGEKAARDLHMTGEEFGGEEHFLASLLCAFACQAEAFVRNKGARVNSCLLKNMCRYPALVSVCTGAEEINHLLNEMMSSDDPVFNHQLVCSLINLWGDIPNPNEKATNEKATEEKATKKKATNLLGDIHNLTPKEKTLAKKPPKKKATEEKATKKKATEEKATEEKATNEKATEEKATKKKATKKQATEENATDKKATKEKATDKKATDKKATKKKATKKKATDKKATMKKATMKKQEDPTNEKAEGKAKKKTSKRQREVDAAESLVGLSSKTKKARKSSQEIGEISGAHWCPKSLKCKKGKKAKEREATPHSPGKNSPVATWHSPRKNSAARAKINYGE